MFDVNNFFENKFLNLQRRSKAYQ